MKKSLVLIISLCILLPLISAQDLDKIAEVEPHRKIIALSLGAGARYVLEDGFADVYDQFNLAFNADLAIKLGRHPELFFHSDFMSLEGALTYTSEKTELSLIPIEAGIRFLLGQKKLRPYLGAGGGFYMFKEESTLGKVEENVFGFFAETGLRFLISRLLFADLKVKYVNFKVKPDEGNSTENEYVYTSDKSLAGLALQFSIGIEL